MKTLTLRRIVPFFATILHDDEENIRRCEADLLVHVSVIDVDDFIFDLGTCADRRSDAIISR